MAPEDTTCVFVPGSWHSPNCFSAVISHLHTAGYNTAKVWTPSVVRPGQKPIPSIDMDVAEVRKHLTEAIDKGQKVILVLHSYSGFLGSMAAEGYDQPTLAAQGHTDGRGIIHIVYFSAFVLRAGETLMSASGEPVDWTELDAANGVIRAPGAAKAFYNDFESQAEVDAWVAELNPWSISPIAAPQTHEPWRLIPATYLVCTIDKALQVERQRLYCRNLKEAGAVDLRVIEWDCGHTPFGTRPLECSRLIRSVVEEDISVPTVTRAGKGDAVSADAAVAGSVTAQA